MNVRELDQADRFSLVFVSLLFDLLIQLIDEVIVAEVVGLIGKNGPNIVVGVHGLVRRVPFAHAHRRADVVGRQDDLTEVLEQPGDKVLGEALAGGEVEREAPHVAEVVHHALQHDLEQLVLGTLIPEIDVYSAEAAGSHREDGAAPGVIFLLLLIIII